MAVDIKFVQSVDGVRSYVFFVKKDGTVIGDAYKALDASGVITNAIKLSNCGEKFGRSVLLTAPMDGVDYVVLIGLGDKNIEQKCVEALGGIAYSKLEKACTDAVIVADASLSSICDDIASRLAYGAYLKSWRFNKYKPSDNAKLSTLSIVSQDENKSSGNWNRLKNIADGVNAARSLVSEPANVIYPETFAKYAMQELLPVGVKVTVYDKQQIEAMGMGAFAGVSHGSAKDPVLLVMQWEGSKDQPIAFVGKGVTFDSGGIDIKPDSGMEEMKYDMAGAATVVGLMKAVAANKCPRNIVCVTALTENMPSGSAQKPGDIVKSMSGLTIEVLNTDAEGRLTLADALWFTQDRFKPKLMIDLATLTGAVVVCLGHEYAGLLSNDDKLCEKIQQAADITGEKVWRLPMNEYFESTVESDIADLKNITGGKVRAGTITAACFLKRFVNGCKWAHLDIAGVEATYRELYTTNPGATGFGVRLLYQLLESCTEDIQKAGPIDSATTDAPIPESSPDVQEAPAEEEKPQDKQTGKGKK